MAAKPLTSIALRARSLEWATVGRATDKSEAVLTGQADVTLAEGQPDIKVALQSTRDALIEQLRVPCAPLASPVALGIPTAWALVRIADLPTTDPTERRSMVELQVDKFSPFPADESVISYEVLAEGEGRSRVLLSAVPTALMDGFGGALRAAGATVKWVDINLLGWWRILNDAGKVNVETSQALAILDGAVCDLVVTSQGVPGAVRALSGLDDLSPSEFAEDVTHEIVRTLTALDLGRTGTPLAEVVIWHRGNPPAELGQRLHEALGVPVHLHPLESLPSLSEGLLRRCRTRQMGMLNLAPPAWQQAENASQVRRRVIVLSAAVLGLWALAMGVLFGGLQIQKRRLANQEARLAELTVPADKVRAVRERVQALEQYVDRSYSALECLREISDRLPPGIELKSFTYHKGKSVDLVGEADAATLVYDFKKEMDDSKLFVSNVLLRITSSPQNKQNFRLTAALPGGGKP